MSALGCILPSSIFVELQFIRLREWLNWLLQEVLALENFPSTLSKLPSIFEAQGTEYAVQSLDLRWGSLEIFLVLCICTVCVSLFYVYVLPYVPTHFYSLFHSAGLGGFRI